MAKTYAEIQEQIQRLQAQAESLRQAEVKEVVDRIRQAIEVYGLTAADLGLAGGVRQRKAPSGRGAKPSIEAKYGDKAGNTWGGRGPRPKWLREQIAAGKSLDDFLL